MGKGGDNMAEAAKPKETEAKLQRQQGRKRERAGTETVEEREAGAETMEERVARLQRQREHRDCHFYPSHHLFTLVHGVEPTFLIPYNALYNLLFLFSAHSHNCACV